MLLWLCFTTLGDWLKKIEKTRGSSPTNQIQNKNQLTLGTHDWTRLALVTCVPSSSSCVIVLLPFVLTGHCDCFGFGFTVLREQRYRPVMGTFSRLAEVVRLRKFRLKCGWLIWCFRLNFLSEFLGQFLEFISSVFHFISLRFEWESSYFGLALSLSLTIAIVKLLIRT